MSRRLMVLLLATCFMGMTTWAARAQTPTRTKIDVSKLGPQVGERVPDFSLPDQNGQLHTLNSIMGPNGALLLFHRSANW